MMQQQTNHSYTAIDLSSFWKHRSLPLINYANEICGEKLVYIRYLERCFKHATLPMPRPDVEMDYFINCLKNLVKQLENPTEKIEQGRIDYLRDEIQSLLISYTDLLSTLILHDHDSIKDYQNIDAIFNSLYLTYNSSNRERTTFTIKYFNAYTTFLKRLHAKKRDQNDERLVHCAKVIKERIVAKTVMKNIDGNDITVNCLSNDNFLNAILVFAQFKKNDVVEMIIKKFSPDNPHHNPNDSLSEIIKILMDNKQYGLIKNLFDCYSKSYFANERIFIHFCWVII